MSKSTTTVMIFLLLLVQVCPILASNVHYTNLVNDLFGDYLKEIRPASNFINPTQALLSMALTAIDDLDERNQILVSSVIIGIGYYDEYLTWDASQYGGIDELIYPQSKLWLPDLVVENSVEKTAQLGFDEMTLLILKNGRVIWKPKEVLRTTCNVDVTYYPFDTQTCSIILTTWTSKLQDINLRNDWANEVNLDAYQESGAWELLSTSIEDVSGSAAVNRISFNFTMKRRKTYYIVNLIVPVIALCATASLVFGLPADAGEKIGMSITVLLAYAVYLTIISETMPKTSLQVSIMGVYLSILLTATALAVVFTVFVLELHHRDDDLPPGNKWRQFTIKLRPFIGLHDLRKSSDDSSSTTTTVSPIVEVQSPKKENTRNKVVNIFRRNKVGQANDENVLTGKNSEKSQYENDVVYDISMDKPNVLWRHVSETVDRFLFILFTSFTALSSVIFICLLSFGSL